MQPLQYYYTVTQKSNAKSPEVCLLSFDMYLEGMGFRAIGRVLGISYGTVFLDKKWGSNMALPVRNETLEVVELDELHSYVGKKNYKWIWYCC